MLTLYYSLESKLYSDFLSFPLMSLFCQTPPWPKDTTGRLAILSLQAALGFSVNSRFPEAGCHDQYHVFWNRASINVKLNRPSSYFKMSAVWWNDLLLASEWHFLPRNLSLHPLLPMKSHFALKLYAELYLWQLADPQCTVKCIVPALAWSSGMGCCYLYLHLWNSRRVGWEPFLLLTVPSQAGYMNPRGHSVGYLLKLLRSGLQISANKQY